MDFTAALPTFVVTLREGFEAALVVGIVLACLKKAGQDQLNPWVYTGVGGGIFASLLVGLLLGGILQGLTSVQGLYTPIIKELLTVAFSLVAIAMLSWMLLWMTKQAKSLSKDIEGAILTALSENQGAAWAIFILVFIAVLREGFETVLFIAAKFQAGWMMPTLGAVLGLLLAAIMGFLLFKWGVKINIRLFFQIMGILLLLIVGGLVIGVGKHLDTAIALFSQLNPDYASLCSLQFSSCILGPQLWNTSAFLPEKKFPGILLKALFGYREKLYLVQAIFYFLFLITVGGAYFQSLSGRVFGNAQNKAVKSEV